MSSDRRFRRAAAVVERAVAGETLLVPIRANPRDKVSVLTLNDVGSFVWAALAVPTTPRALAQAVTDEFEVAFDQALADLLPFLERLRELGLADPA
jgi:hypothetical protein